MNKSGRKGMALITVLLLTTIMVLMTLSMIFMSINQLSMMGNISSKTKALKAAEAGIEYAIYMLDKDPAWGLASFDFVPNNAPNAMPTYAPDYTAGADVEIGSGTKFVITFSNSKPEYRSVNNLFQSDPNVARSTGIPCYTARIVSTGICGSAKKILEAYLLRSDYYDNITSEGCINLISGSYAVMGTDPNKNPVNEDPNLYPGGRIYSGWETTPTPGNYGVEVYSGVNNININGGSIIAKRDITFPTSLPAINGTVKKNSPKNLYLSKIDVPAILSRAKANQYGAVSSYDSDLVIISDVTPAVPLEYSRLVIRDSGTGLSGAFSLDPTPPPSTPPVPPSQKIYLNQDIFINGDKTQVYNDRNKTLPDLAPLTPSKVDNVVRIYPDQDAFAMESFYITTPGPTPGVTPGPITTTNSDIRDELVLDLNGHNIYSNSHLVIGLPLVGKGKIISYGKIYCISEDNDENIILISEQDLELFLSERVYTTHSKGLYYASDDLNILPLPTAQPLYYKSANIPNYNIDKLRDAYTLPPGTKLRMPSPPYYTTSIGRYAPLDPNAGNIWWEKGYTGNNIYFRGNEAGATPTAGVCSFQVSGYPIEFTLEYVNKYVNFNGIIKVQKNGSNINAKIYDPNADPNCLTPIDPADVGLTQDELDIFAREMGYALITPPLHENNMQANLVSFNNNKAPAPANIENKSRIDCGEDSGFTVILNNPDYMKEILNLQRKSFNVRLIACYEIE